MLVDREPFKIDVSPGAKLRFDRSWDVDGRLQTQVGHAVLDNLEIDSDDSSHLDGAAEGNFSIALAKVQVAHRELCAIDVYGQVDFGAAAEVLDAVPVALVVHILSVCVWLSLVTVFE
jgi:hypothetical protein